MLTTETKRRIDNCRNYLVGKLPLPTDQVELITLALIYKFMDDMDEQSVEMGGKRAFFTGTLATYRWREIMSKTLPAKDRMDRFAAGLEALGDPASGAHLPELFRDIFRNAFLKFRDGKTFALFVGEIDGFTYAHSEELGNAFEYLLQSMATQGQNGHPRRRRSHSGAEVTGGGALPRSAARRGVPRAAPRRDVFPHVGQPVRQAARNSQAVCERAFDAFLRHRREELRGASRVR